MSLKKESQISDAKHGDARLQINKKRQIIHIGEVIEVIDDGTMRLRVKIKGIDDKLPKINKKTGEIIQDIPLSHCFMPIFINICPQVGETVKILLTDSKNPYTQREWIGPLISQPQKLKKDLHYYSSTAGREGSLLGLDQSFKTVPSSLGIYPEPNDIALQGRNNADIVLKNEEVLIRAGKFIIDKPLERNEKNPAYINIRVLKPSDLEKKDDTGIGTVLSRQKKDLNLSEDRTDTVIMSNKIFLVGRDSNSKVVKPILKKKDHINLENKLHPVVYGDVLVEFLNLFQNWMNGHTHPYPGIPPDPGPPDVKLNNWFTTRLPSLLSRNVWVGGDIDTLNSGPTIDSPNSF